MNPTRRTSLALVSAFAALAVPCAPAFGSAAPEDEGDALPNVFISPCGRPFRARIGAPYPVADWFKVADADHDGKLERAEFVADAAVFFKYLDLNGDGVISPTEVAIYEHRVCPEVLGQRVRVVTWGDRPPFEREGARLWLAQIDRPGEIDPGGGVPPDPVKPKGIDESTQGASPYSLFDEPEPIMAADLDFTGIIRKENFLKLADAHFTTLDSRNDGFLTLAGLPMTPIQKQILKEQGKKKR